jgi:putative Mn2+ efflux pump MntP
MIHSSRTTAKKTPAARPLTLRTLIALSIATSIDALAIGVTLSILHVSIIQPILIIGIVTFVLSFLGSYLGNRCGHLFERNLETIGGIALILLGIKIPVDELFFPFF